MHRSVRRLIFAFFVLVFVISAPLVVLYTAGYRLNISNRHLQQTGVLAITTFPRGSSIILNRQELAQKTPSVIQRLTPNAHTVTLHKLGYHDWNQVVTVEEGKTTYVTARLFAVSEPRLLLENEAALAVRNHPNQATQNLDSASVALVNNGANIEVRVGDETGNLIGLLPLGNYQILEEDNEYLILSDEQGETFIISRQGGAVVELPVPLQSYDWLDNDNLLLWSDGTEVNIYEAETNRRTFITREGQQVIDVAWHPDADSFFVASTGGLSAYDMSVYETRQVTPLLPATPMADIWLDTSGKNLYFTTEKFAPNQAPGNIFELQLSL